MQNVVRMVSALAVGLLVGGLLVTAGMAWRISRGPIELEFLTPQLEATLAPPDGSATVDIGSTALEWDPLDRDLDVRVHDLRILGSGGAADATVPELAVSISPGPLLLGTVAPRAIELIRPRVRILRTADGRLEAKIGEGAAADTTRVLASTLLGSSPAASGRGVGAIPLLRIRDGEVVVDDQASASTWTATNLRLAARRTGGDVAIEELHFDLGPATVSATGTVRGGRADLNVVLEHLPTKTLEGWWPAGTAPAMRDWTLQHVSGGGVTKAEARVTGAIVEAAGGPRVTFDVAGGRIVFGRLEVRWRDGMPPLTGVGGIADVGRGTWTVRLLRGELDGIELVRATVSPRGESALEIDGTVRSPLSKVLALMERPGVRAAANIPFRPGEISGGMTAHVLMTVPLAGGRTDLRASGELRSVSLRRAFRNRNVNARRMEFELDPSAFEMLGEVTIGRAPLALRWREQLAGDGPGRRVVDVKGRLDAEGRRALGIDLGNWITGPVDAHARLVPRGQGTTAMHVTADLERAAIDLPLLNMVKAEGAPGTVDARLAVAGGQLTAVHEFRLRAAGSSIDGRALFGPGETWRTLDGTIVMAPRSHGAGFTRAVAKMTPGVTGSQLTITADDAGAVLRAVDAYADATGGRAKVSGEIRPNVPGMPFTGTLDAERFVLHRSPMIAKIAAMGPVTGIVDALAGDGLPLSQLSVTFTQRAGVITIAEAITAGPGIALTVRGSVDRPSDELSLEGTLVPNHEVLAKLVPSPAEVTAFSDLDVGRVRALDFSVSGSLADPYVSASPSTSISSSTLRDLLRLTTGGRMLRARTTRRGGREAADEVPMEPELGGRSRRGRRGATSAGSTTGGRRKAGQTASEVPRAGNPPKPGTAPRPGPAPKAGTAPKPGTPPKRGPVPAGTTNPRPPRAPARRAPATAAPGVG